jgi:hypothetical protein
MDGQRKAGNELLCISHKANLTNGIMFPRSNRPRESVRLKSQGHLKSSKKDDGVRPEITTGHA